MDYQSLIVVLHVKNIINHSANSSCSKPIQKSNPWRPSPSPGQEAGSRRSGQRGRSYDGHRAIVCFRQPGSLSICYVWSHIPSSVLICPDSFQIDKKLTVLDDWCMTICCRDLLLQVQRKTELEKALAEALADERELFNL